MTETLSRSEYYSLPSVVLGDDFGGTVRVQPSICLGEGHVKLDAGRQGSHLTSDDARALALVLVAMADQADAFCADYDSYRIQG